MEQKTSTRASAVSGSKEGASPFSQEHREIAAQKSTETHELERCIEERSIAGFYSENAPPGSPSRRLLYFSPVMGISRKIRDFERS